ncbi:hypothetical protein RRG08_047697 [Elysia crispata]|uniref:Uncharacterized protein n=1 Tax=Elysia crispata TaxID=231223 RepID=A0AAE0ZRA5_9GAST|nr:hypothetical protein RRG08_047697 [Elysia crispata]
MMFTSQIEHRFGIHASILVGDIFISLSFFSVYFIIKEPLALALIFGGLHGASVGVVFALIVKLLLQKMPNHGGLATGIMSAGPTIGTILYIGVAFAVINPSNKKPDLKVDNKVYFSDKNLISRVPTYFLVVGAITAVATLSGAALMYIGSCKNLYKDKTQAATDADEPVHNQIAGYSGAYNMLSTTDRKGAVPLNISGARFYGSHGQDKSLKADLCTTGPSLSGIPITEEMQRKNLSLEYDERKNCEIVDLSPREALKTARFWLVWLAFVTSNHTFYIHLDLYKEYGEQAISDDSMLITTGIISNVSTIFICPLVGIASDKIGIRNTSMILNAASCLFMSLMVITIHTCPWMYMVLVVIENIGVAPHTMIFSIIAASEFGKIHCASNMGFIRTGNIPLVLLEPFIVDALIRAIGWDWVFLTGSLSSAIATIAIIALDFF